MPIITKYVILLAKVISIKVLLICIDIAIINLNNLSYYICIYIINNRILFIYFNIIFYYIYLYDTYIYSNSRKPNEHKHLRLDTYILV